jgi:DNA-binding IclR family transcriptional regulator
VPVRRRGRIVDCINCVWLLDAASEREIVARYLPTLRKAAAKIAIRLAR